MNGAAQTGNASAVMPGAFRLDSSKYKAVFAEKASVYGQTLVMWVARLPDAGRRAGVVVSKKTFRRAVDRNRAKRLMREAFRLSRRWVAPDVGVVLVARRGIAGKTCQDVLRDFERVCRRAKVWREQGGEGGASE